MRRIPGILLVLLAVASARAQKPVQHIVVSRHDTIEFSVVDWENGDRYTWDIYDDPGVNFALENDRLDPALYFVDGMYEGSTVYVTNLPPGQYYVRVMVWDEVNCTNNLLLYSLEIEDVPEADIYGAEACFGDITYLRIVFTGVGPWDIIYTDGMEDHHVNGISEQEYYHEIPTNTMEPNDEVIIKEYWINYINDVKIESSEPTDTARIIIYPIPTNSEIYIKEDEEGDGE
ncbi:hypothetical protein SAMN05444280_11387 [Tangfeifania diversioriginum]|uniref:Uncharacterized protein n=2 Tax=Tangfeifania diversioriginum TaxID=1168035 RepID=A0A1M6HH01_9BACT|nr:hypothetical protein SAMN05444280_11387 [Tangfeifania diversioriginum]